MVSSFPKVQSMLVCESVISDWMLAQPCLRQERVSWCTHLVNFAIRSLPSTMASADRLASFRRAFNKAPATSSEAPVQMENKKANPKKALACWRKVLDKVFALQQLLGCEESVNSWLPQEGVVADVDLTRASPEELAEYIKGAPTMSALQSKVKSRFEVGECNHGKEFLIRGGNQWGTCVICKGCNSRWAASKSHATYSKKKKSPSQMPSQVEGSTEDVKKLKEDLERMMSREFVDKKEAEQAQLRMRREMEKQHHQGVREEVRWGSEVGPGEAEDRDGRTLPPSGSRGTDGTPKAEGGDPSLQHCDGRVRQEIGTQVRGGSGILRHGDVPVLRGEVQVPAGDSGVGGLPGRVGDADLEQSGESDRSSIDVHGSKEGEEGIEVEVDFNPAKNTWVRLRGGFLREKVQRMQSEDGLVKVQAIYEQHGDELLEIEAEELDDARSCVVELMEKERLTMEDALEEDPEIALPKKLKNKLRKAHTEAQEAQETFKVEVSEVYSPPRIVQTAKRSGLRVGGSYDIKTGYDLKEEEDYLRRMWDGLVRDDPELVCTCPPCTPFSMLQELNFPNMAWEDALWLVGEGVHHVEVSAEVCWWQHLRGKYFAFEHPRTSRAWKEKSMERLILEPGVYVCYLDMCAYGMKVGKAPNRKPTMWITNSWYIAQELQRRCSKDHQHEALMGGKAALAAVYPEGLCQAIVRGLKRQLRSQRGGRKACPEELQEVFVGDGSMDVENVEDAERGEEAEDGDLEELLDQEIEETQDQRVRQEGRRIEEEEKKKEREDRGEEGVAVSDEDKRKIRKLHVNLGHPSLPSFLRFLKAGRVREEVRSWVRHSFNCPTCQAQQVPKAPRPAVVPKCYSPGVVVGIDIFYIPDPTNTRSLPILSMVDLGTNYHMVEYVESKEPERLWGTFWKVWARTFGLPQYVTVDEGREFRGGFSRLCSDAGVIMFRAAARAPWQQGKVERHGGVFKMMVEKSREEMPPTNHEDLIQILYACESAKNRYANRSGYSPTQRQIGQWPRMPSSLLSDEDIDPALQSQNHTEAFQKLMEIRQIAMEAFVKVSSREAAARALKARPRVQVTYDAGDVVYVYRVLRRQKTVHGAARAARGPGMGRKATWVGPGYVLAIEGSVIWVNMMGELWKAAAEQVRKASTSEKMGIEIVNESVPEMQERLKRGSHQAGYRDITKEEVPEVEEEERGEGEEDEVVREGRERGMPRPRVEETQGQAEEQEEESSETEDGTTEEEGSAVQPQNTGQTEPEREAGVSGTPTVGPIGPPRDSPEEQTVVQHMVQGVAENQRLDGVPATDAGGYDAMRGRWRQRTQRPYFAEFSVFFEDEGDSEIEEEEEKLKKDYWVFDQHKKVLQRHHVTWRRAKFNPSQASGSPIPLRALREVRTRTQRMQTDGKLIKDEDKWSLFTEKESRYDWWKGITEFEVDEHFLYEARGEEKKSEEKSQKAKGGVKKKRGEGEVFTHEIEPGEWPLWQVEDKAEFEKILKSGALRLMSLEESIKVKQQLEAENKMDRILPSRMVRRYKPGEQPGDPRSRKSRFCIRGDRDPDAIYLNRFAPTVTTSNLQVLIQASSSSEPKFQRDCGWPEVSFHSEQAVSQRWRKALLPVMSRKHAGNSRRSAGGNRTWMLWVDGCAAQLAQDTGGVYHQGTGLCGKCTRPLHFLSTWQGERTQRDDGSRSGWSPDVWWWEAWGEDEGVAEEIHFWQDWGARREGSWVQRKKTEEDRTGCPNWYASLRWRKAAPCWASSRKREGEARGHHRGRAVQSEELMWSFELGWKRRQTRCCSGCIYV